MIISSPKDTIILIYNIYLKSNLINQWGYEEIKKDILISYNIIYKSNLITIACKADGKYGGSSEAWIAVTKQTIENFFANMQWTYKLYWFSMGN